MGNEIVKTKEAQVVKAGLVSFQVVKDRAEHMMAIRDYAISQTLSGHWYDEGGKPFLGSEGTDWIARIFGMKTEVVRREKLDQADKDGDYYLWLTDVRVSLPGGMDSIEGVGIASSKDKFLGTETRQGREIEDVVEPNLILKSYTAAVRSATTRLLCLRGMTWEILKELGINRGATNKVEYKKKGWTPDQAPKVSTVPTTAPGEGDPGPDAWDAGGPA